MKHPALPMRHFPFHRRDVMREVRELSQPSTWRGLAALALDWGVILAAALAAVWSERVAVYVAAVVLIGARQHGLLVLMHDAAHFRLHPQRRVNDLLAKVLSAWPLLVSLESYRGHHLAHHRELNTDKDPDWRRKAGDPEWRFPKTRAELALLFAKILCGRGVVDALQAVTNLNGSRKEAARGPGRHHPTSSSAGKLISKGLFYVAAVALVTAFEVWPQVLLLWFLPAFTALPLFLRVRSMARHFGIGRNEELDSSRNYVCPAWERLLFCPHNVGYHLDHHLFPAVPFYNLPALHKRLMAHPGYRARAHNNRSLFGRHGSVFDDFIRGADGPLPADVIRTNPSPQV